MFSYSNNKEMINGFLPNTDPIILLPENNDYQQEINEIIKCLPELLKNKQLRTRVDKLNKQFPYPELMLEKHNAAQKNLALAFLAAIAQAYVFESDEQIKHIPSTIATPLYQLAKSKQRYPMLTYADYVLHNWQRIDKEKGITLENIKPIFTLTNTQDEAWFIMIHVAIEAAGAKALLGIQKAYEEAKKKQPSLEIIEQSLKQISDSVANMIDIMHRLNEKCDPEVFWLHLRSYLGGWDKVKPLNCDQFGVWFEGVDNRDKKPLIYSGPTGAQSSIVPALDEALKIKHEINGMYETLQKFKNYMPKQDQAFILQFSSNNHIKHMAKTNPTLELAYNNAVIAIQKMRGAHIGLVHAYIYQPAKKQGIPKNAITGTGGSGIGDYLGNRLFDTKPLPSHYSSEHQSEHKNELSGLGKVEHKWNNF